MSKQECYQTIQAVRTRIGLLAPDGSPDPGPNGLIVSDQLVKIDYKMVIKAGANLELENGQGRVCASYQGRDTVKSVDLVVEYCVLDAEQIELKTGGGLVTLGGESVGWTLPDPEAVNDRFVSFEAWSLAWDGDEQAVDGSDVLYHHWVWPRTSWVIADGSINVNPLGITLNGHATSNKGFGNGPGNDLPWGVFTTPMGEFIDDAALPAAACGYQTLVAS